MTSSTYTNAGERITITVKQERRVSLPMLPNFIRDEADKAISIADLSEEQLREIGKQWTDALVRKAYAKRHQIIKAMNTKLHGKEWMKND